MHEQDEQGVRIATVQGLFDAGLVERSALPALQEVASQYAIALTPTISRLVQAEGGDGPISRQFIPTESELIRKEWERDDPIGDEAHSPVSGIVHRYPDRALLTPVLTCPVYCRFCFRREAVGPGKGSTLGASQLDAAFAYLAAQRGIREIIITGGDPLIQSPRRMGEIAGRLRELEHIRIVRYHTRVPVVEPQRVTAELIAAMCSFGRATYVVLHVNSARELTAAARDACGLLVDSGIPMLSQSVLLKGVNDTTESLSELLRALVEIRVKPYYLHHLDPAPGTDQFRVSISEGQKLVRGLRGHHSGLMQPTYVLDIPGGHGKSPIGDSFIRRATDANGTFHEIRSYTGAWHRYEAEPVQHMANTGDPA
ncbi:lysine-2,3-aminomutase-like protein [Verminephrobacter aporrectodeae subsp. tuberculatae]|uniref:lysine-2,3-aminomutase-like protein n=1 Tax=Verminephrobacter aporrectodeae TaxID=1110389 RepID=UPI0022378540|nr:lysine-2,3-aminomutase-like protein [Verminephrobacter aporrectodeae]MCW5221062.1 lysine-2,3-aminomutase-like protein [Verminephrobacter aporrectodeae subsp. tuberculatae]MCW5290355.1 lysine-2,3-aminomutase-like protein [Verminephrobacter aporrectodeae subsp. tuberculatae]